MQRMKDNFNYNYRELLGFSFQLSFSYSNLVSHQTGTKTIRHSSAFPHMNEINNPEEVDFYDNYAAIISLKSSSKQNPMEK